MPLAPGSRLGPYEVIAPLGVGGMGEVYRARDTKLHRDVALKVLPEAVAADADRLARFEREARTLASLNHPHIAQIYGVEESSSVPALVMELVEGATLEELIFGPARPAVDDVLAWFRQIADALEAAHDAGIVHRDLKPANVKLRPDGTIKVLDFGLAKAIEPATAAASASMTPTMTSPALTAMGLIMGTAAYMAPEQARGRLVDRRADIWAFGVMLHEALTGERGFQGETVSDTIAAILTTSLDLDSLPRATPAPVRALLARCLEKEPKRRLRDIGEARLMLEASGSAGAPVEAPAPGAGNRTLRGAALVVAGLAVGAAATWAVLGSRPADPMPAVTQRAHVALMPPEVTIRGSVISPDGRALVYSAGGNLWVHRLDQWEGRVLVPLVTPTMAAWSPRSDAVAYVADQQVFTIEMSGGTPRAVARVPPARSAPASSVALAWANDNRIVLTLGEGPLYSVNAAGGDFRAFAEPPDIGAQRRGPTDFHIPAPLPGRAELLAILHRDGGTDAVVVVDPAGTTRIVFDTPGVAMNRVMYSPTGHLVFGRSEDETIWAVPFSLDRLRTEGEPFRIGSGRSPSVGPDGTLFYIVDEAPGPRRMVWVNRGGDMTPTPVTETQWGPGAAISPDGSRVAAPTADGLWVFDLATGTRGRLTSNAGDRDAVWLPDGRIAFAREAEDQESIYVVASGGGGESLLADRARAPSVDAKGTRLVFNGRRDRTRIAAWIDLSRPAEVHEVPGSAGARFPMVSPDGTLMLFISNETGQDEVWVTRFPSGEGRWQVSSHRGGFARWSSKGDEILFRGLSTDLAWWLMSIRVRGGTEPSFLAPEPLFRWGTRWMPGYALTADAQRLLAFAATDTGTAASIRMERHWTSR